MTLGEQEPPVAGVLHEAPAGLDEALLEAGERADRRQRVESVQGEERVQRETGFREISTKSPGLLQFGGGLRAL